MYINKYSTQNVIILIISIIVPSATTCTLIAILLKFEKYIKMDEEWNEEEKN